MLGLITSLFSNNSVIDKAASAIDKMILTDEERLEFQQKKVQNFIELEKAVNMQSLPRGRTRRWLALPVVYVALAGFVVTLALVIFDHPQSAAAIAAQEFILYPFLSVIVFYFGPHLLSKVSKK